MAGMRRQGAGTDNVRMGPLALFTLVAIVCLSVLAVLAVSTSNATLTLSQRRADATRQLYLDETAAQTFVAALDEATGDDRPDDAALAAALAAAGDVAPTDGPETLEVTATLEDDTVDASFDCGNGRQLKVTIGWQDDGSYRVEQWRVTTVQNDAPAMGTLLGSSRP